MEVSAFNVLKEFLVLLPYKSMNIAFNLFFFDQSSKNKD